MKWIVFRGLFGTWGWERLDDGGEVVGESAHDFETIAECVNNAAAHGYLASRDEMILPMAGGSAERIC